MIPVIDLFAGPGGLCEGFSHTLGGERPFRTVLSIEKDKIAHQTLELRAFVHYFMRKGLKLPDEYYSYISGKLARDKLFDGCKKAAAEAKEVAWLAELGGTKVSKADFDARIKKALNGEKDWLLIGGPPCQAYSLAGRSRSVGGIKNKEAISREEAEAEFNKDPRQRLYRQYLRVIAVHSPAVFVMENVAGMLSAKVDGKPIFPQILRDLKSPAQVAKKYFQELKDIAIGQRHSYHIFSFVTGKEEDSEHGEKFLIKAEEYGVPQCRHRVILLGVRDDLYDAKLEIKCLGKFDIHRTVSDAIGDLPKVFSSISSKRSTMDVNWDAYISSIRDSAVFKELDKQVRDEILAAESVRKKLRDDGRKRNWKHNASTLNGWYNDENLVNPLNHEPRSHMPSDLWRYLFVASYGTVHGRSPVIADFPEGLLPAHSNIQQGSEKKPQDFADRFKVQLWNKPSSTVTSHISKDGHYFIHPDPAQCRSLTVREAARLQTFPDNYFFEGNRTQQYHQVGNAVPPYLAKQLAEIVYAIFKQRRQGNGKAFRWQ